MLFCMYHALIAQASEKECINIVHMESPLAIDRFFKLSSVYLAIHTFCAGPTNRYTPCFLYEEGSHSYVLFQVVPDVMTIYYA